jgi:type I restriction enzyme S subunit
LSSYYEKFLATREVKCIDEEIPFEIPNGWEWARLNSYSDVRDGTHDTPQYVACGYPLITSKDFIGGIFDLSKTKYIDEQTFIEINKRSNVQIGDILFSMIGGNIGSMILITRENYFDMAIKNVALFKQYIYNDVLIKYLYFYLQSQVVSIKNTALGGAQSFVSLNMLRNYLMPIPPLNEQKKIIEKFKLLDFVIQQYEKSYCELNNLKHELFPKLKKSILQEAIQGKLVPQIEEEGTAQELLEQIKTEKEKLVKEGKLKKSALTDSIIYKSDDNKYYEQIDKETKEITEDILFDLPNKWQWCRIGIIFMHNNGKQLNKGNSKGKLMKYITTSNLYWDGFVLDNLKEMPFEKNEIDRCMAVKGDLLVCEGGDIGRSCIWNYDFPIMLQNHIR